MPASTWPLVALALLAATAGVVAHLQARLEDRKRPCRCQLRDDDA